MEVQVNVAPDGCRKISGYSASPKYYDEKAEQEFGPFRIPWNASTTGDYKDSEMMFSLERADAIGMTGWNFKEKKSYWVGYDFDSITGHAEGVGISEEKLEELVNKCRDIDYVHLYKSTSGNGYHLYILFDGGIPTANHDEHSAIAHSLINVLTIDTGFDFSSNVDCFGKILWCWARRQEGTDGLQPVFTGRYFPIQKLPINWKDYIKVKGESARLKRYTPEERELMLSIKTPELDKEHRALLTWFSKNSEKSWWFDNEMKMLVGHTKDFLDARQDPNLGLVGLYDTTSPGSDATQNCYAFPLKKGAWVIRRYGQKTSEHPAWEIDEQGWTKVVFNQPPTFERSCQFREGLLDSGDFYNFEDGTDINLVFSDLLIDYKLDSDFKKSVFSLKKKSNKIIIRTDLDGGKPKGFIKKSKYFEKVIIFNEVSELDDSVMIISEEVIRHCNSQGQEAGWFVEVNGEWVQHPKMNIGNVLQSMNNNLTPKDISIYFGNQITNPWKFKPVPFGPEYPGGRFWNRNAAQLAFKPEVGRCDTWFSVLNHVGLELNDIVVEDEWCITNGIQTGGDFLLHWIASMFQRPEIPLPYLFIWGKEQDTGKSTLHESIGLLLKDEIGYMRADHALQSSTGFNKELENCVLAFVEETDLSGNNSAANKIKDYVTSLFLSIRAMQTDAYLVKNNTHWIHTSNTAHACPMMKGDTRIMSMRVQKLYSKIPKDEFREKLISEGPAFTNLIMSLELPAPNSRLGLPCLETQSKKELMEINNTVLDRFLDEKCHHCEGYSLAWQDFFSAFQLYLGSVAPEKRGLWSSKKTSMEFSDPLFPKGKYLKGNVYLGNMQLQPRDLEKKFKLIYDESSGRLKEGKLNDKRVH